MRLVSYNILDGGLGRADPIAEILEAQHADVITLLEADDPAVVDRLARRLKMDFIHSHGNGHACAILSRFAIRETVNHAALSVEISNTFTLATIAAPAGGQWHVGAVHLKAHATLEAERQRVRELSEILARLKPLRDARTPHVLAGDFNANSPVQKIEKDKCKPRTRKQWDDNGGMLPREVVQVLLDAGYVDSLNAVRKEAAGMMGTFSTHFPGQRVDYIFTHGFDAGGITDAWIETDRLATYASDHYPIGAELQW